MEVGKQYQISLKSDGSPIFSGEYAGEVEGSKHKFINIKYSGGIESGSFEVPVGMFSSLFTATELPPAMEGGYRKRRMSRKHMRRGRKATRRG